MFKEFSALASWSVADHPVADSRVFRQSYAWSGRRP